MSPAGRADAERLQARILARLEELLDEEERRLLAPPAAGDPGFSAGDVHEREELLAALAALSLASGAETASSPAQEGTPGAMTAGTNGSRPDPNTHASLPRHGDGAQALTLEDIALAEANRERARVLLKRTSDFLAAWRTRRVEILTALAEIRSGKRLLTDWRAGLPTRGRLDLTR